MAGEIKRKANSGYVPRPEVGNAPAVRTMAFMRSGHAPPRYAGGGNIPYDLGDTQPNSQQGANTPPSILSELEEDYSPAQLSMYDRGPATAPQEAGANEGEQANVLSDVSGAISDVSGEDVGATGVANSSAAESSSADAQEGAEPTASGLEGEEAQNQALTAAAAQGIAAGATGAKRGGIVGRADGGSTPFKPWYAYPEASGERYGLLASALPGRHDRIATSPAADSFVVPADVVSALGEGNTLSGAHVLTLMMNSGPRGIPEAHLPSRSFPQSYPSPPPNWNGGWPTASAPAVSRGGVPSHNARVPIIVAGGEFIIPPHWLARLPGAKGDVQKGQAIMRRFCQLVREKNIKELKKLPPPVK